MTTEQMTELAKQHRTAQNKNAYYLLAIAASAIAWSIKGTQEAVIEWSMIPLGLAVISWIGSFYLGYKLLDYYQAVLIANYHLFVIHEGLDPKAGKDPVKIEIAKENLVQTIKSKENKGLSLYRWQFRMLVLGALFYLAWHVTEMVINTLCGVPPGAA
jgi:hypothetical protein